VDDATEMECSAAVRTHRFEELNQLDDVSSLCAVRLAVDLEVPSQPFLDEVLGGAAPEDDAQDILASN
jgi:hypothetical protein